MSQNTSAPEERQSNIPRLPERAEQGITRRQQQFLFDQVKLQVLDTATRYFELSLSVLKKWLKEGR